MPKVFVLIKIEVFAQLIEGNHDAGPTDMWHCLILDSNMGS